MDKYYHTLGLESNADINLVKKTYKKLAVKYHPDKNKSSDAEAKFKEITNAYQKICNPSSIDDDEDFINNVDLNDIVNNIFGNFMPTNNINLHNIFNDVVVDNNNNKNNIIGSDIFKTVNISLSEIFLEKSIFLTYNNKKINPNNKICPLCNGKGFTIISQQLGPMLMQSRQKCNNCLEGKIDLYINIIDTYEIKLKKSLDIYKNLIIKEKGLPIINGINGNLIIKFIINTDLNFKIKNYNLYQTININFKESLLGFSRGITLPDNNIIEIHSNIPINNDTIKIIDNEALYNSDTLSYGNIIIKIKVRLPESLSIQQQTLIAQNF